MIAKTQGIVLSRLPYSESSLIVKILTQEFGLRSYIIKACRQSHSKHTKAARLNGNIFQPLHILNMVVYDNNSEGLNNIKEAQLSSCINSTSNINKFTIAFFLTEIITSCIKEREKNPSLYSFLYSTIEQLDSMESTSNACGLFPVVFLALFAQHLGYEILDNYTEISSHRALFDLQKGCFVNSSNNNLSRSTISEDNSLLLHQFLLSLKQKEIQNISFFNRQCLLDTLLQFYYTHIIPPNSIKSYPILVSLLH